MNKVVTAEKEDVRAWLELAVEVEHLFGPLVNSESFNTALINMINEGTAFCMRKDNGSKGSPLMGGMLFSTHRKPIYEIGWLAVSEKYRGSGVGQALMNHIEDMIELPCELVVTTFIEEAKEGEAARRLYEKNGLTPMEILEGIGPFGSNVQVFRKLYGL